MTAQELAERTGFDTTMVVRFAQKIGYQGWPDMRNDLRFIALADLKSGKNYGAYTDTLDRLYMELQLEEILRPDVHEDLTRRLLSVLEESLLSHGRLIQAVNQAMARGDADLDEVISETRAAAVAHLRLLKSLEG